MFYIIFAHLYMRTFLNLTTTTLTFKKSYTCTMCSLFYMNFWEQVQHCAHVNKRFSLSIIVKCTFRYKCKCILELIKNNTSNKFRNLGKNYTHKKIYNGSSHFILDWFEKNLTLRNITPIRYWIITISSDCTITCTL